MGKEVTRIVKMQWVPIDEVEITNTKIKRSKVAAIIKEGIKVNKLKCFPAWKDPETGKYILTDGNHRCTALRQLGVRYAPIAELTKAEFDYVKFSFRKIELIIERSEYPQIPCD